MPINRKSLAMTFVTFGQDRNPSLLLIPGLAMTNSIRNILVGNTISGLIRLTESLIWAVALAGGVMTAILIVKLF